MPKVICQVVGWAVQLVGFCMAVWYVQARSYPSWALAGSNA